MAAHAHAGARASLAIAVLTVSDTRTDETDASGREVRAMLESAGHRVHASAIVPDDPDVVRQRLASWLADPACDGAITNGGTGISPRDRTFEAIVALIERPLPGFGELFRMLSYREIGSAAMLSRAIGGISGGKLVFSLPGSTSAVRLAMGELIGPELSHLASELKKPR